MSKDAVKKKITDILKQLTEIDLLRLMENNTKSAIGNNILWLRTGTEPKTRNLFVIGKNANFSYNKTDNH